MNMKSIAKTSRVNDRARKQLSKTFQKVISTCEKEKMTINYGNPETFAFAIGPDKEKKYKLFFTNSDGEYITLDENTNINDAFHLSKHTNEVFQGMDKAVADELKMATEVEKNLKQFTESKFFKSVKNILSEIIQKIKKAKEKRLTVNINITDVNQKKSEQELFSKTPETKKDLSNIEKIKAHSKEHITNDSNHEAADYQKIQEEAPDEVAKYQKMLEEVPDKNLHL